MINIFKFKSLALVLCLLCSVCIAPAMAGSPNYVMEDGVHLAKYDDSPTQLDPHHYSLNLADDVVVDGDQFYWVRIGNVKASKLSSNEKIYWLCVGSFVAVGGGVSGLVAAAVLPPAGATAVPTAGGSLILYTAGVGAVISLIEGTAFGLAIQLCPSIEKEFVAKGYRVTANDGTILMGIKKTNTAGIRELKTAGLDIGRLTHLSKDGNVAHRADL